jgi:tripeptidyl-peptidase I
MRFLSVAAAAALLSACAAAPSARNLNHVLHEKRGAEPHQWTRRDRAAAHENMPIRIGLRQRNLEHAERFILDVSDPHSPNYGRIVILPACRSPVNNW